MAEVRTRTFVGMSSDRTAAVRVSSSGVVLDIQLTNGFGDLRQPTWVATGEVNSAAHAIVEAVNAARSLQQAPSLFNCPPSLATDRHPVYEGENYTAVTEFDKLYHFVAEMNNNWRALMDDIDSGRFRQKRAAEVREFPVVDAHVGNSYGRIVVDGNGTLRSISLNVEEIALSNEGDVLEAIRNAVNSPATRPVPVSSGEGVETYV